MAFRPGVPLPRLGLLAVLLTACTGRVGFDVVSVSPRSGWVDGCGTLQISGHGFPADVTKLKVSLGGETLTDVRYPDAEEAPLDVGFVAFATRTPAAEAGYADLLASAAGDRSRVRGAHHYLSCPAPVLAEALVPAVALPGDAIAVQGCNLDAASLAVRLHEPAADLTSPLLPLTTTCGTAEVTFTVPTDLEAGAWEVVVTDRIGNVLSPGPCVIPDTASLEGYAYYLYTACDQPLDLTVRPPDGTGDGPTETGLPTSTGDTGGTP